MRRTIYERNILPNFRKRLLTEIEPEDLRALCAKATAMVVLARRLRPTGSN